MWGKTVGVGEGWARGEQWGKRWDYCNFTIINFKKYREKHNITYLYKYYNIPI